MGNRLVIIALYSFFSIFTSASFANEDNADAIDEFSAKNKPVSSALLLDERFPKMLELATQPKEHILKNAKNRFKKKQDHPFLKERKLKRMKNLRARLRSEALQSSQEMGLKLNEQQEKEFIIAYWQKRSDIEKTLFKEIEPRRNELTQKVRQELKDKFTPASQK